MQLWNHAIARILERMEDTRKRMFPDRRVNMQLWNHAIARILERMEDTRKRMFPDRRVNMQLWNHAIARILERMEDTRKRVGNNYPHWCDYETGKWTTTVDGDWTGGFWPGMHWLGAEYTSDHRYRAQG